MLEVTHRIAWGATSDWQLGGVYSRSQIAYVTVAGKYLKGAGLREKGATWGQKVVGAGYAQVTPGQHCACASCRLRAKVSTCIVNMKTISR